ncbi:UPF0236 family transposase-like protein [Halarsenatibacter silvermanii]|uniref:Uncharacterized protein family (UPF0236) n=1 Tax=Halarsenatibacter silvermanii TaxID=321763 RepID=A0A1G9T342_9FIRM|nr:UPF0236 family protein [Halarsenatibacter silvermanii]SDM41495.1 Uncharacterised protein family (UPF0236) [Halarsenatibacter silvermanii]
MMKLILSVLYRGDSFKGIEEELLRIFRRRFIEFLVEVFKDLDEAIMETRDKDKFKVKGIRERTLVTSFGEITFQRRYYYDREADEYRYLLDEMLKLPRYDRVSNLVKEKALTMVRDLSYRKSATRTIDMLGANVSASSLHSWVQDLGGKKRRNWKKSERKLTNTV